MNNLEIKNTERLLKGFLETCEAVGSTMGGEGSLAIYETEFGFPIVTKDGISVAKSIYYKDKHMAMGNYLAKQAALRTVNEVGDSTSTSLVLASAIVKNSLKKRFFTSNNYNKKVEKGFEIAQKEITKKLEELSKKTTDEDIRRIATISSNNNTELGQMILDAYKSVNYNGIVDFKEDLESVKTKLEVVKGMLLEKGMLSPFLKNNNNGNWEADDVLVVAYSGYEAGKSQELQNFINKNKGKNILIVVERNADENFIRSVINANAVGFNITVIECPFFDPDREMLLQDIAIFTGGQIHMQGEHKGKEIIAGKADRVIVTQKSCSIINKEQNEQTKERIEALTEEVNNSANTNIYTQKRLQMLKGVASTIYVGAVTDTERREIFDRVEDAVKAVKASLEEGWIAGGGSTLSYISKNMTSKFPNKDIQRGYDIIKKSIEAPFLQICKNANIDGVNFIDLCNAYGKGINTNTGEISNLIEDGVIDSVKSQRVSLENAISVAKMLLNTKVVVNL